MSLHAPQRHALQASLHVRCGRASPVLEQPAAAETAAGRTEVNGSLSLWRTMFQQQTPPQSKTLSDCEATISALESVHGPLDPRPLVPAQRPLVLIISGPSGVGKDSVLAQLKQERPDLYFVVTATSRPKRPNEIEGKDYFFVTREKFEEWISQGQMLEHALVYGDYKGIPRQQVDQALAAGTDVVLRIDVQGAATVKQLMPEAISIFIAADSEAKLVQRLVSRKTETLDKMTVRVATARHEMEEMKKFDYVVVNQEGCLEQCAQQIGSIINAEKARVNRLGLLDQS